MLTPDWLRRAENGLAFLPLIIGYGIAYISFVPAIRRNIRERNSKPGDEHAQFESRLWWLLYTVPCLPIVSQPRFYQGRTQRSC